MAPEPPDPLVAGLRAAGCVYAEEEAAVLREAARDDADLEELARRRMAGQPLEHVVGVADLAGARVQVTSGVFVPRRRSELLVELAGRAGRLGGVLVELCCGSGALAVAVAGKLRPAELHATDVDPVAVRCAATNLGHLGGRVHQGDLYAALPRFLRARVDVLVASPPYVPSAEIDRLPRDARLHEPRHALDGGPDGMDLLRRVAAEAPVWLAADGGLFLECSAAQGDAVAAACERVGLTATVHHDDATDATVVTALAA